MRVIGFTLGRGTTSRSSGASGRESWTSGLLLGIHLIPLIQVFVEVMLMCA